MNNIFLCVFISCELELIDGWSPGWNWYYRVDMFLLERLSIKFTANGKRQFIPREQVSPLLVISSFMRLFILKNCFELGLTAHFLFWEILNLNLLFAICGILEA